MPGPAPIGPIRSITLRRDGKGALKFNGERIKSASRSYNLDESRDPQIEDLKVYDVSAKLFKTSGGKFVLGIEVYNKTDELYETRWGQASDSLAALAEEANQLRWVDDDILGEVFEGTEIGDHFVEHID